MDMMTAQALVRFGLGRRGTEPLPGDPVAWLLAQLKAAEPGLGFTAATGLAALQADRRDKPKPGESQGRALFRAQADAELACALTTETPFRERLLWFWANHFTVSLRRGEIAALAGSFIEEAIRPHVTGRFQDMLLAVMRHPAMLLYLDNAGSVAPDSPAGQRSGRGLNENLARECLELHTVTPAARYTQADVTAFARLLTGWSVELRDEPRGFRFRERAHEPAPQTVMGQSVPPGEQGGVAMLRFLANHPATQHALAVKLTRHFTADEPSPKDVRQVAAVLRDTGGNLGAAAAALLALDAAWQPCSKLRTPFELVVASARALDVPAERLPMVGILSGLGQPLLTAPAPDGWPDRAEAWASPEAMMRRIEWANGFAARIGERDALAIAQATLGPLLRPVTLDAMAHAGSRRDAFTLFLTSPEFQRR